uniref:Uncharacterized protein n=1 Tax=uncultured prokaryote TaxID=198431 RepID=A0A0H5Q451_9ZZZZ|nr:hypothetical protein [uncultured prokaryote]
MSGYAARLLAAPAGRTVVSDRVTVRPSMLRSAALSHASFLGVRRSTYRIISSVSDHGEYFAAAQRLRARAGGRVAAPEHARSVPRRVELVVPGQSDAPYRSGSLGAGHRSVTTAGVELEVCKLSVHGGRQAALESYAGYVDRLVPWPCVHGARFVGW